MSYYNNSILGLFQNNTSNSYSGISFTDYASIRSGAYKKLLKSYYGQSASSDSGKTSGAVSRLVNNQQGKNLTSVRSNADELSDAAKALYKATDYDKDAVNSAVKSFVSKYNDVIKAVDNADSSSVLRNGIYMAKQTDAYSKSLAKVGITINYDNTLTVDEKALSDAAVSDVKTLFNGVGSFAYQTAQKAEQIGLAAKQSSGTSLYGSNGSYNYYNYISSINSYI
ncbi:MAG: flagellar hook-associated protein [Butyrivibrio sp.]